MGQIEPMSKALKPLYRLSEGSSYGLIHDSKEFFTKPRIFAFLEAHAGQMQIFDCILMM